MNKYSIHENGDSEIKNSRKLSVAGAVISLILLAVTAVIAHKHSLSGWQASLFHGINNGPDSLKTFALWVSEGLGSVYPIVGCVLVPLLLKNYRLAWRFFVTVGGAFAATEVIKKIIGEPRPAGMISNLHIRAIETGQGFPSGHATAATAMALTLWFVLPSKWRWVSVVWILAVAWSRLYLGVHSPVDVVGGFAIGWLAVCIVRLLPKAISNPLRLDS